MDQLLKASKAFILTSSLLLLFLVAWVSSAQAAPYEQTTVPLHNMGTISAQGTPTVDPTVTALEKVKLEHDTQWLWNFGATLFTSLFSTIALIVGGVWTLLRYLRDQRNDREKQRLARQAEGDKREEEQKGLLDERQIEREKRLEERFQVAVEALGSERKAARIGAAILLRSFLRRDKGYEQFYSQVFDLAVAHLRLRIIDSSRTEPPDSLSQALITLFKESFPYVREELKQKNPEFSPQTFDATHIRLDNAYLAKIDLQQVWMPEASLQRANLERAELGEANLMGASLSGASLRFANLKRANLEGADFKEADLYMTDLSGANLWSADLRQTSLIETNFRRALLNKANLSETSLRAAILEGASLDGSILEGTDLVHARLEGTGFFRANLKDANLREARLNKADMRDVDLSGAQLQGADLSDANLSGAQLQGTDLSEAKLTRAYLRGVKGLTDEQLEEYLKRGAIIDYRDKHLAKPVVLDASQALGKSAHSEGSAPGQEAHPSSGETGRSTVE